MKLQDLNIDRIIKNLEILREKQENNNLIIQHNDYGEWKDSKINDVEYDISEMRISTIDNAEMRIKPEPQYRPYAEVKEEWLGKKVKSKRGTSISMITGIEKGKVCVGYLCGGLNDMFKNYIWGNNGDENDGKPFGDVVE